MNNHLYDTIVIGSGISGMAAGIILAMEGERILIVEQHSVAGGMTQTYSRKGKLFPTGVHRLGSLDQGQPLWYYLKYLGLMDRLDFVKLDDNCFEKVYFPGKTYDIPMGHDTYQHRLIESFPDQEKSISTYFSDLKHVISNIGMYDPSITPQKDLSLQYTLPLEKYLDAIGISGRLKSLLTANSPLYGISSLECPLLTHFIISDSYLNSSFRINETNTPFSDTLANIFKSNGGEVSVNSCVKTIMIKDRTATGVILNNNEVLLSKKVIFSGHPCLILDICPPELFRPVFRKRLNQDNTPGSFGVALKWKKATCPLEKNDVYIYDSWDVNDQFNRENILKEDSLGMVYLSALPEVNRSDTSDQTVAVTALTGIGSKETALLNKYYKESKTATYQTAKNKIAEKILHHIEQVFPDLRENIEVADTYSPVTFQRYTLTKNGSAYGIKKTAQHFLEGSFLPATKVKNLFLTGQSIGFNGIHGSIVSSVNLCQMLLGKEYLTDKIVQKK
ncbi:MAG: FAD-dependent oxidoreductase [Proteobacteria bacterium]|nr:FAD-dependent oxidoreductase [Pseudomonadota bacterium]MBU1581708.1 FAD-dependent oxidoreductase [Pseudomonadota bacterium]MBU2629631.1 FAD-dependent oxidoreductase [Pseudomonadota bacterium]